MSFGDQLKKRREELGLSRSGAGRPAGGIPVGGGQL